MAASVVNLILTEFAQCHLRDHLEDGSPQPGLLTPAADAGNVRGKGNLPKTRCYMLSLVGGAQTVFS